MITYSEKIVLQLQLSKHAPERMVMVFASDTLQARHFYILPNLMIMMGLKESNQLMIVFNITC